MAEGRRPKRRPRCSASSAVFLFLPTSSRGARLLFWPFSTLHPGGPCHLRRRHQVRSRRPALSSFLFPRPRPLGLILLLLLTPASPSPSPSLRAGPPSPWPALLQRATTTPQTLADSRNLLARSLPIPSRAHRRFLRWGGHTLSSSSRPAYSPSDSQHNPTTPPRPLPPVSPFLPIPLHL